MLNRYSVISIFIVGISFLNTVWALQTKPIADNGMAWATVSTQGLTRLAIDNDRIVNVRGPAGAYNIQNDNVQGAVFLQPSEEYANKSFTVFIATEQNHNYVLRLTPKNQVADTILLKPKDAVNPQADHWEKTSPYTQAITDLIQGMINQSPPDGYAVNSIKNSKTNWLGSIATFTLKQVYSGAHLEGRVYLLQNKTPQVLSLNESQLYQSGDRAIAIDQPLIQPNGETLLYKVVSHE